MAPVSAAVSATVWAIVAATVLAGVGILIEGLLIQERILIESAAVPAAVPAGVERNPDRTLKWREF